MLPKGYRFENVSKAKTAQAIEAGRLGRLANTNLAVNRRKAYNESPNRCLYCQAEMLVPIGSTSHTFSEIKKKKFCNRSCGAKGRQQHKPKVRTCLVCGVNFVSPGRCRVRCIECKPQLRESVFGSRLKSECRIQDIRTHARLVLFRAKKRKCEICGYDVRVDCCHIKAIKEFSKDSFLSEINSLENLKALCPNHHAEFDLGILDLSRVVVP